MTDEMSLQSLVQQVEILSSTFQAALSRNEELAKSWEDMISKLHEERVATQQEREFLQVASQGLEAIARDLDQSLNDLSKTNADLARHDQTIKELLQEEG